MNSSERQRADEMLERAIKALREQPVADAPPQPLQAATIRSLQNLPDDSRPRAVQSQRKRNVLFNTRVGGAAAALLAVGLLVGVFLAGLGSSFTFADVLDKVQEARSVHFVATYQMAGDAAQESKVWIQDNVVRYEISQDLVMIVDTSQRKGLEVHLQRKAVKQLDLVGEISADELRDPIDQLRNLKEQPDVKVTQLADEMIGQQACRVYRIDGATALRIQGAWTIWVDAETSLPVKMQVGDENVTVTFEQMVWNEALDPSLFSLNVPEGFAVDAPIAVNVRPGNITYHVGRDVYAMRPDGSERQRQFAPESSNAISVYAADQAELSPDGRLLAIAYSSQRDNASYPPERILLWDRTQADRATVEAYAHPGAELSHWRFSADGKRLYVAWWKELPDKSWPHGVGADFVDLETNARTALELPMYTTAAGEEFPTQFGDVAPDGKTYVVAGQQLQLLAADGQPLRMLTSGDMYVEARSVRFSPDGRHVLYVSSKRDVGYQLSKVAVAGGEPQVLIAAGQFAGIRARWSPDGAQVVFSCRSYNPNHPRRFGDEALLNVIRADGTGLQTLIREAAHPNAKSIELTAWQ